MDGCSNPEIGSTSEVNETVADTRTDAEEPLLKEPGTLSRLSSVRVLLVALPLVTLLGGVSVGIWLLADNGSSSSGGSVPFQLVNRTSWGAAQPKKTTPLPHPPASVVVIIHTASAPCDTEAACAEAVRDIQRRHLARFDDIAYNFLVGGDGRVYEGRGWGLQGAFAHGFNNVSLGVAFIGNFNAAAPPTQQLEEAQALIAESLKKKQLPLDYALVGHRQVSDTDSPGEALYDVIKMWPHWKDCYKHTCETTNS